MAQSTPAEVREMLARLIRENYDPGVLRQYTGVISEALIGFNMLGCMFGAMAVWPHSYVAGCFRSQQVIPGGKQAEVVRLFDEENVRILSNVWSLGGQGEVVLRVNGLRLRGGMELQLRTVKKRLFRRLEVMDRRIGIFFVASPGVGVHGASPHTDESSMIKIC